MNEKNEMLPVRKSALASMASRFNMDASVLLDTLKNTVFKGATNEQLAALVIVATEHNLNPFTREIYAFPDKSGGIQAVVGVDGWIRIITQNPNFDGVEFSFGGEKDDWACTCTIHVKGRSHGVIVTEYLSECKRNTDPWRSHPRRMLRHKALIQAGRVAFGFGSLKDEDDAVIHPASVTVSKPVFNVLPEPSEPEDNVPMGETAPAPVVEKSKSINYVKGLRGMLKLASITETELLEYMRANEEWDDSLSSLEEVQMMFPHKLQYAYEQWETLSKVINAEIAKGTKK